MNPRTMRQPRSYFSPDSIRDRYAQRIQNEPAEHDPLMDIAHESVEIMRRDGKSEGEIRSMLETKFQFSDKMIDQLLKN